MVDLRLFVKVDHSDGGVDLLPEALYLVNHAVLCDAALNVVVVGYVKVVDDVALLEGDASYSEIRVVSAVVALRQGEGEVAGLFVTVAHNVGIEPLALAVNEEVAVGAHVLHTLGAPDGIVGEADLDELDELGVKGVRIAGDAVDTAYADALVLLLCIVVIHVAVYEREAIAERVVLRAEANGVGVWGYLLCELEGEARERMQRQGVSTAVEVGEVVDRALSLMVEAEEQSVVYRSVLAVFRVCKLLEFHFLFLHVIKSSLPSAVLLFTKDVRRQAPRNHRHGIPPRREISLCLYAFRNMSYASRSRE